MIKCEFHPDESCKDLCKYYNDCEFTLPWNEKSSNTINEIRGEIRDILFCFNHCLVTMDEKTDLNIRLRELRAEEFRIIKQLKIKRDRK